MDTIKQSQIIALVESYKGVNVSYCHVGDEYVTMRTEGLKKSLFPFAAKKILTGVSGIKFVYMLFGAQVWVYSINTLKYGGYVK